MDVFSYLPLIGILIAGLSTIANWIWGSNTKYRNLISTIASIIAFLSVVAMIPGLLAGKIYAVTLFKIANGISIKFRSDSLGLLFALVITSMWIIVNVYTIGYMGHEEHKHRFFTFFSLAVFAALGIALAENLLALFIFYEILTLSTYPLVAHVQTEEAFKAGAKYLIFTMTGGGFLLAAMVATYFLAGSLSLSQPGLLAGVHGASVLTLRVLFFAFLIGFGVKAAIMPMHYWLPAAMVAPTPVSTLLHAVAVVKAGVFGILRLVVNIYGLDLVRQLSLGIILAVIASFTIVVASVIALRQDHLKKRLAYSTIAQLSYIVLGAALASPFGIIAAMFHIVGHAFAKGTLFMCAGTITHETGYTNVSQLDGVGKRMPYTMTAFTIGALSMIGLPPLGGFITKWYLGIGATGNGWIWILAVLAVSTLLNCGYFLPIIYAAFFKEAKSELQTHEESHGHGHGELREGDGIPSMVAPLMTTAILAVVVFFWPNLFIALARLATKI